MGKEQRKLRREDWSVWRVGFVTHRPHLTRNCKLAQKSIDNCPQGGPWFKLALWWVDLSPWACRLILKLTLRFAAGVDRMLELPSGLHWRPPEFPLWKLVRSTPGRLKYWRHGGSLWLMSHQQFQWIWSGMRLGPRPKIQDPYRIPNIYT